MRFVAELKRMDEEAPSYYRGEFPTSSTVTWELPKKEVPKYVRRKVAGFLADNHGHRIPDHARGHRFALGIGIYLTIES